MNCGAAVSALGSAHFGPGSGSIWLDDVVCSGSESSLTECPHPGFGSHNCGHGEDTGVICSASQIRLVGSGSGSGPGSTRCSGRVEVFHGGTWGTVCDDGWDLNDAQVVCRQMNCGTALSAPGSAHFGRGSDPTWLDDVACSGSESSLTECPHPGFGTENCGHSEDAGVICSASLPKPSISMNPATEVTWGQSVSITCSISAAFLDGTFRLMASSGSRRNPQTSTSNSATFNIPTVTFENDGSYQCQSQKTISSQTFSSPPSDPVTLRVTVNLHQPSISVTSPSGGLVWVPEGAEVTRGHSFVITCSVSTGYPGGRFTLISDSDNVTTTEAAVNNSASFNFSVAEYEHQGNYSCVYEVTGSTRTFTSPQTAAVHIIIKFPLLLLVLPPVAGGLLLFLLVFVVIFLIRRRRSHSGQIGAHVQTQIFSRVRNPYGDKDDDGEEDYINVDEVYTKKLNGPAGMDDDDDDDDHDYEEAETDGNCMKSKRACFNVEGSQVEGESGDSSDDEADYENVTQPPSEQYVDIYGENENVYANYEFSGHL
ncbi:soluble scavenger receptor cysteine-rich domain-containing protein SSC5D-like isoform X2 [Sphaeramia orbicularis]|uniref:soluble scavenger receptor cysteine-rich domain-containing protein SSC5D-like isoform X2 n=1 Tax=Sphaeramia orbicularis TaxID=375764 RepID=UPI00117DC642|nr:soluble scavenger receptor cysteine-rich domain-containing protein SSC5D-like isoform X2 [Sphaeramia orbicularis]